MLTIDANIFVSARMRTEINHSVSSGFLDRIVAAATEIYCPTLVLPETAAAVIRSTGRPALAERSLSQIRDFPYMTLVEVTAGCAEWAADIAVACRLRGADAVYAAVAQEYGTTLITWDQELLTRAGAAVAVMTPADWLTALL